jgi:hypothetical protein
MKDDTQTDVAAATDTLEHGYREETQLYMHVSRLTWKQHDALREESDLDQFHDLRDEKEDLLQMVEEIESGMRAAQAFVLSKGPSVCLGRFRLNGLLDRLMETLEEIRIVESDNASLLDAILLRSGWRGLQAVSAGA